MARKFKKKRVFSAKKKDGFLEKLKLLSVGLGSSRVKLNENLKFHTFSGEIIEAEGFFIATNLNEMVKALNLCLDLKIPFFILGAGTKIALSSNIKGLVIKNRMSQIKVAGVKGKISKDGIGVEEAFVEADSGVSKRRLNEFLNEQKLKEIEGSFNEGTIGGSMISDPLLQETTQSLKIWEDGEVLEIKLDSLKRDQVVLSVIFKFKAKA